MGRGAYLSVAKCVEKINIEEKLFVSVHLACPYIQENKESSKYEQYVDYLELFFKRNDVESFLKDNPHLFGTYVGYESELEKVFEV